MPRQSPVAEGSAVRFAASLSGTPRSAIADTKFLRKPGEELAGSAKPGPIAAGCRGCSRAKRRRRGEFPAQDIAYTLGPRLKPS